MSFRDFDLSQDGTLTEAELKAAYDKYKVPVTDSEISEIFRKIDRNNDGVINFSEYCVAAMPQKQMLTDDKLQAAFRLFDKDSSGLVSLEELQLVLATEEFEDFSYIVRKHDKNGDGEISYDEFAALMKEV